jgi:hypothetical protein
VVVGAASAGNPPAFPATIAGSTYQADKLAALVIVVAAMAPPGDPVYSGPLSGSQLEDADGLTDVATS